MSILKYNLPVFPLSGAILFPKSNFPCFNFKILFVPHMHRQKGNLLGQREPSIYGSSTLESIENDLKSKAREEGAQLESSKNWAKDLMKEAGIPTARHWIATTEENGAHVLAIGR